MPEKNLAISWRLRGTNGTGDRSLYWQASSLASGGFRSLAAWLR